MQPGDSSKPCLQKGTSSNHKKSKSIDPQQVSYITKTKTREVIIMKNNHEKSIIKLKQLKICEHQNIEDSEESDYSSDMYEIDLDVNQKLSPDNTQEYLIDYQNYSNKPLSPIIQDNHKGTIQVDKHKISIKTVQNANKKTIQPKFASIPTDLVNEKVYKSVTSKNYSNRK